MTRHYPRAGTAHVRARSSPGREGVHRWARPCGRGLFAPTTRCERHLSDASAGAVLRVRCSGGVLPAQHRMAPARHPPRAGTTAGTCRFSWIHESRCAETVPSFVEHQPSAALENQGDTASGQVGDPAIRVAGRDLLGRSPRPRSFGPCRGRTVGLADLLGPSHGHGR
jgi:hypothetical protein